MKGFSAREVMEGVFHIRDAMGVFMTLIVGKERALLVDAGYGLADVSTYIKTLTDRPVRLLLTHAHHDHALGSRWFDKAYLFWGDMEAFSVYSGAETRTRVAKQAEKIGIAVPQDYMTAPMPEIVSAREEAVDLGGMTAQIMLVPGHTLGSAVVYAPEKRLLISGDNWNPCTWLFFPEALPTEKYRENMKRILKLPFEYVLCSHRETLWPRRMMETFFDGLTDEALLRAKPVPMGWALDTREAQPAEGQQFVFDFGKAELSSREVSV